jgi:hypothetical protein
MYEDLKIDTAMPLPTTGWKGAPLPNYPKAGDYPWQRMKVGDSFFIALPEGGDIVRLMNRITGSGRYRLGRGMVSARCVVENNQIGVRAWKIASAEEKE